jgi:chloramphenicol-sensitive protein RarD
MQRASLDRTGIAAGLLAYFAWGLLPLLFLAAERAGAGAAEIVAWRTIWAVPCTFALVHLTGQGRLWRTLPASAYAALMASASLIGLNWLVYVYAVHTNQTITASLGYFINPLLNIAAGALLFSERIGPAGIAAACLATFGVVLQGLALVRCPGFRLFWASVFVAMPSCASALR